MGTQREKVILEMDDRLSAEATKATGSLGKLKTAVKAVAATAAAAKIAQFAADTVQLAIDAEEAGAAFDTTFGPAAEEAGRFVEDFANKAGFANFELQQMLAVTGNVVQGLGATESESLRLSRAMATLSGDVASFSNAQGGAQAVMAALQSAINGEREALKTYGLAVSEAEVQARALADTGKRSASELTRLEKAEATLAVATEKAGKAIGDLDRTQDSTANSMRRLSAEWTEAKAAIGDGLIPVLEAVIPLLSDAAGGMKTAGGWIAGGVSFVTQSVYNLRTALGSLPGEIGEAEGQLRTMRGELNAGVPLTESFAEAIGRLDDKTEMTGYSLVYMRDSLGLADEEMLEAIEHTIAQADALELSEGAMSALATGADQLSAKIAHAARQDEDYRYSVAQTAAANTDLRIRMARAYQAIDKQALAAGNAEHALLRQMTATDKLRASNKLLTDDLRAAADPVFNMVREWENLETVLADPEASLLDIADANLSLQSAMDQLSPGTLVEGLDSIARAADTDRESIRLLLEGMGLLDGYVVRPVIDLQVKGATRIGLVDGEIWDMGGGHIAADSGGYLDFPLGTPVPLTAHGQERILSADQNRIFEQLAAAVTGTGGDTYTDQSTYSPSTTLQVFIDGTQTTETTVDAILDRAELAGILSGSIGGIQ